MEKERILEVRAFLGLEGSLSLLMVALPQLWLGNGEDVRQERPLCGFVLRSPQACALDTVATYSQRGLSPRCQRLTVTAGHLLPLLSESVSGGGGAAIAKNSRGLWDLLFRRNQWN